MQQPVFYTAGYSDALHHARNRLIQWGYVFSPIPSDHVTHLLLPVPSLESPGIVKGGQSFGEILQHMPENITIIGGNLPDIPYRCIDMLKDEFYLQENAQITAQCARDLLQQHELSGASVLLIGWGRIAKRLFPLLRQCGACVTVAIRSEKAPDALLRDEIPFVTIDRWCPRQYDVIVNTAPAHLLDEAEVHPDAVLLDLASVRGISGSRVLWARGLPNRFAPEASGTLIAKTVLRYALGKEST